MGGSVTAAIMTVLRSEAYGFVNSHHSAVARSQFQAAT